MMAPKRSDREMDRRRFIVLSMSVAMLIDAVGCRRRGAPYEPATTSRGGSAEPSSFAVVVQTRSTLGPFNRLSGVQGSPHPIVPLDTDHRERYRACSIEHARFPQDCPPNTLTLAALFPDERADPDRPGSYRFASIDAHMRAAREAGTQVLWQASYDVGGSDRWVGMNLGGRAPTDWTRWSRVVTRCLEHFNNGWAGGLDYAVRAVEFPNEPNGLGGFRGARLPELIPAFVAFLRVVERYNQAHATPVIAVGPGIPFSFDQWGTWQPRFRELFSTLQRERVALPAFSFHTYGDDVSPAANARVARALRALLDEHGMDRTELWNTEWQGGDFLKAHLRVDDRRVRGATAEERALFGVGLATYALSCKARWQGVVDRAYYYRANRRAFPPSFRERAERGRGGIGTLFSSEGALLPLALQECLTAEIAKRTPMRCGVVAAGDDALVAIGLCARDGSQHAALLCNLHPQPRAVALRFDGVEKGATWAAYTASVRASRLDALERAELRTTNPAEGGVGVELVIPRLGSVYVRLEQRA